MPQDAWAQLSGHNILGDNGLQSASQAPPGLYAVGIFQNYNSSTIRNRFGDQTPSQTTLNLGFLVPAVAVVTPIKILGANYGFIATFPFSGTRLAFPRLDSEGSIHGFTDMYVRPLELGWHTTRADVLAGYGFYAPSGRFRLGASDNTGLGMWSHELLAGTTLYFDKEKKWHLGGTGFYEIHSKKKDVDTKVGDILTIEGGLGRSLFKGLGNVGAAYYGQWKITKDDFPNLPGYLLGSKNRVNGLGPEFGVPIPLGKQAVLLLRFRYMWEFAARSNTQGQTLHLSATIPLAAFK